MAVLIKRSAVAGKNPATTDLALGELAINTHDGNMFFKKNDGTTDSIVQVATNNRFANNDSGGNTGWLHLGTATLGQNGLHVAIKIIGSRGFDADYTETAEANIHFMTSNGHTVDSNGFGGACVFYRLGWDNGSFNTVKVVSDAAGSAATKYDFYVQVGVYSGASFYEVQIPSGSWSHVGTFGTTDVGPASSTVCIAKDGFNVNSVATFNNGVVANTASFTSNVTSNSGVYENSATITTNYVVGAGNNAMSAGPITIANGASMTLSNGSVWTIVM